MTLHAESAAGRWRSLSLAEQLANVGSEVERAISASERGRTDRFERALARALELFDLTAADDRWLGPRRREILRWREEFCGLFFGEPRREDAPRTMRAHFLRYAILARREAGKL